MSFRGMTQQHRWILCVCLLMVGEALFGGHRSHITSLSRYLHVFLNTSQKLLA